jgi:3-dehydrotetronate 4-kinase
MFKMKPLLLGCIADDFTGATDLASNLVQSGMRVVQTVGVPLADAALPHGADAVVIALKSRTIAKEQAIVQSLAALAWLQQQGAKQIYFKYCSTFDSTPEGNIGPVTDALMDALGTTMTIATPASPENGRTVYQGNLFVGNLPLHESGMKDHPLTPMRDSDLQRVLQAQTQRKVGLLPWSVVSQGVAAIRLQLDELQTQGVGMVIVDALRREDLMAIGSAVSHLPLLTAGSGVAVGLAQNFGISSCDQAAQLPPAQGRQVIISGSCSQATNAQVAHFLARGGAGFAVDPLALAQGPRVVQEALAWVTAQHADQPILIYATAAPAAVKQVQAQLGVAHAGALVEHALASIAQGLLALGLGRLIVAGGETSGACVQALQIKQLQIGAAIAPGVPWCYAHSPLAQQGFRLTLKSGNFGAVDFFTQAFMQLDAKAKA